MLQQYKLHKCIFSLQAYIIVQPALWCISVYFYADIIKREMKQRNVYKNLMRQKTRQTAEYAKNDVHLEIRKRGQCEIETEG